MATGAMYSILLALEEGLSDVRDIARICGLRRNVVYARLSDLRKVGAIGAVQLPPSGMSERGRPPKRYFLLTGGVHESTVGLTEPTEEMPCKSLLTS